MNFIIILILGIVLEIGLSFWQWIFFPKLFFWFLILGKLLGIVVVFMIIHSSKSFYKDIPWIVMILLFPFVGSCCYFLLGSDMIKSKLLKRINERIYQDRNYFYLYDEEQKFDNDDCFFRTCGFPISWGNQVKYFASGNAFFDAVKEALLGAEKFIFIEFFTISSGNLWESILAILEEKCKSGVEVRLIYDNTACMKKLPVKYYKKLASLGIKCEPFFKNHSLIGLIKNHHVHQKFLVVDGRIAFTGGVNIEDEYINLVSPYGYWKDVGVSVCGKSVWNFTVMFLSLWNALLDLEEDYTVYQNNLKGSVEKSREVCVFSSNPLANRHVSKNIYIHLISQAKRSIFILTPYLILDMDIYQTLVLAVKRGVAVHIIIPFIPDKRLVYQVSLLNAQKLMKEGVKVYTYTPGFMHGKVLFIDEEMAVVGTINTDYRSFYLDFECGVWMRDVEAIKEIKKDIDGIMKESCELGVTSSNCFRAFYEAILLLISPLM